MGVKKELDCASAVSFANEMFADSVNMNVAIVFTVPHSNDFSQKCAVLDGLGTNTTNPTNVELNAALKNISGTAYPLAGTPSGVYFATITSGSASVMAGGGIYV